MTILTRRDRWFLAAILIYSFVPVFGGLLRVTELAGAPSFLPVNPRAEAMPLPVVLHILGSSVFFLLGALQFLPNLRRHRPVWHRRMGVLVAFSGCVSAVTGLWMTLAFEFPPDLQGPLLFGARILLSLGMLILILLAIQKIREGHARSHGAAMLRAYAIGQGASTQTVLGILFLIAVGEDAVGLPRDVIMVAAWLINLLIAQAIIQRPTPAKVNVRPTG